MHSSASYYYEYARTLPSILLAIKWNKITINLLQIIRHFVLQLLWRAIFKYLSLLFRHLIFFQDEQL